MKYIKISLLVLVIIITCYTLSIINKPGFGEIDLTNLTYNGRKIKTYAMDEFDKFVIKFNKNKLPEVYITEFLFDGVGMYKPYDLDDFKKDSESEVKPLKIQVLNINRLGTVSLKGDFKGMLALNTNNLSGDINILLNGVNLNTNTKKAPAIYVYNKDTLYTKANVTIETVKNTSNYIEGGKLKKISLMPSESLDEYKEYYGKKYSNYSNYFGVYTKEQIDNILFAKVEAKESELKGYDPFYSYKAAGVISSDVDLTFKGKGYLRVKSLNNEGIESKGNLTLDGGKYYISAFDDGINTTMGDGYRNTIKINVDELTIEIDPTSSEGDAIDSNGLLVIDGGIIKAFSKPGKDSGLDSNNGTIINGGTIIATGDAYDKVLDESKQRFIVFSFEKPNKGLLTLLKDEDVVFELDRDTEYKYLIYSSTKLDGEYSLYRLDSETEEAKPYLIETFNIDQTTNIINIKG